MNNIIIFECLLSGLITLLLGKIILELKIDKKINTRKPIEIYISFFITGLLLQFICNII